MDELLSTKGSRSVYRIGTLLTRIFLLLSLLLVSIIYIPQTQEILNFPKLYVLYAGVLVMAAVFFIFVLFLPRLKVVRTIFDIPLLAFIVLLFVSSLISVNTHVSTWGRPDTFVMGSFTLLIMILWVWFFIQYTKERSTWHLHGAVLMFSFAAVELFFLIGKQVQIPHLWTIATDNLIGAQYSNLSIFAAVGLTIAIGMLGVRGGWVKKCVGIILALLSFATLLKLGFLIGWAMVSVGLFGLLAFSIIRWHKDNIPYFVLVFVAFMCCFIFAIIESPQTLQRSLPAEVALGPSPSWQIVKSTLFHSGTTFFAGSGLGTFVYDFALFRNPAFNTTQFLDGAVFYAPYSSFFAFVSEAGILPTLFFFVIVLLVVGTLPLLVINRIQPFIKNAAAVNLLDQETENFRWELATVFAAWMSLTAAFFFTFFEVTLWWLWWTLAAFLISGFSILAIRRLSSEKILNLSLRHPYGLVKSFMVVVGLAAVTGLGVYLVRFYLADRAYVAFAATDNTQKQEAYLKDAIALRRGFTPYSIKLAEWYLDQASELSRIEPVNTEKVVSYLGQGVQTIRTAIERDPNNFKVWETAGTIYYNSAPLVDGALQWAKDSFEKSIALAPSDPNLWWQLGNVYVQMKDVKEAEKNYQKAIELKKDFLLPYISLATVYEEEQKLDQAIAIYREVPPAGQKNPDILFNYGRLFFNRDQPGDMENAEIAWLAAVDANPKFSNALFSLGALYEKQGSIRKAREYYQKVLDLNPENAEIKAKLRSLR